jgi:hypothetical protein
MHVTYPTLRCCSRTCSGAAKRAGVNVAVTRECNRCGAGLPRTSTGRRCTESRLQATLVGRLRSLDLLQTEHIPGAYLRASVDQSRALLACLLDTDGTMPDGDPSSSSTPTITWPMTCTRSFAPWGTARPSALVAPAGRGVTAAPSGLSPSPLPRRCSGRPASSPLRRCGRRTLVRRATGTATSPRSLAANQTRSTASALPRLQACSSLGRSMVPTHYSVLQKELAGDVVDRGREIVVPDRTAMESTPWAASVTKATVVDINDPTVRSPWTRRACTALESAPASPSRS